MKVVDEERTGAGAGGTHVAARLADWVRGRLGSETAREVEAHLLVCDLCFAALIAAVLERR